MKKRRTTLYRDGFLFLGVMAVIFLSAAFRQVNLLLLFASILGCFLVFDYRSGRRILKGLSVRRKTPSIIRAGEPFPVDFELVNQRPSGACWGVVVEETVTFDFGGTEQFGPLTKEGRLRQSTKTPITASRFTRPPIFRPLCYFEEVKAGGSVRKSWAGRLPLRGLYRLGPVTVSTRFPLGFFRSALTLDLPGQLTVSPRPGHLAADWLASRLKKTDERSRQRAQQARSGEEMAGIREWQAGDTRKWVHWRASAKYQRILVRRFQEYRRDSAVVILDLFDPETERSFPSLENRELAVSLAATLLAELGPTVGSGKDGTTRGKHGGIGGFPLLFFGFVGEKIDLIRGDSDNHSDNHSTSGSEKTTGVLLSLGSGTPGGASTTGELHRILATARETRTDGLESVFRQLLAKTSDPSEILLVTTRPFDPLASDRLGALAADPRFRSILTRIEPLDVSDEKTAAIFYVE